MKNAFILFGTIALLMTGCAHGVMRGSVAMKTSDREAHVCLNKNEVKPGDKVKLFTSRCTPRGGKGDGGRSCEKVYLGNGAVTEILNEHYSLVTFDEGVSFEEGSFVEKM